MECASHALDQGHEVLICHRTGTLEGLDLLVPLIRFSASAFIQLYDRRPLRRLRSDLNRANTTDFYIAQTVVRRVPLDAEIFVAPTCFKRSPIAWWSKRSSL